MEPVVTAVVPSYRGASHLTGLLSRLLPVLDELSGDLVLVDDCSDDGTWELMRTAACENGSVTSLRLGRRSGQQAATLAGCRAAAGRWIVTLDDDLEHDPIHIKRLLARGEEGFDLVYAIPKSRSVTGGPPEYLRRAGSMLFGFFFSLLIGKPWGLKLTSFRAMRADLVKRMLSMRASAVYISALALGQHPRIAAVSVEAGPHVPSRTSMRRLLKTFVETIVVYGPLGRLFCRDKVNLLLPIAEICGGRS